MRQITVEKTGKTVKVERKLTSQLKDMGLLKRTSYMKKELIYCPSRKVEFSPLYCLVCENFVRRVKGVIYCKATD